MTIILFINKDEYFERIDIFVKRYLEKKYSNPILQFYI